MDKDYFYCSGGNEETGKTGFFIRVKRVDGSGDALTGLVGYIHNPFLTDNEPVLKEDEPDYKQMYFDLLGSLKSLVEGK